MARELLMMVVVVVVVVGAKERLGGMGSDEGGDDMGTRLRVFWGWGGRKEAEGATKQNAR